MIGCFVRSKSHAELGIGKCVGKNGDRIEIEFFDSPIATDRHQILDDPANVAKIKLTPQTRVYFFDEKCAYWRSGRIYDHIDNKCYISLPNQGEIILGESQVFTRWNRPIQDPCEHLAARVCETPYFHSARAELLASFVRQRAVSVGMTGFLSAPIALERHQVEVVRRVLHDPVQRYLLADEVGLGKTIEAGVIIRQFVLDHIKKMHRVLVIVPETLVAQWESELFDRCQLGERFGHNVMVLALEKLTETPREKLIARMVVVDEAHQAVRGWEQPKHSEMRKRFEVLRSITAPQIAPRLLLLSATPVRRNEDGFLALLHLLDPAVYNLSDKEAFREKVAKRQELADLFYAFTEDQQSFFLEGMVDQLAVMFPLDSRMLGLLNGLRPWLDPSVSEGLVKRRDAIRVVRTHLSETYRLHRRLLRNRRSAEVEGLLPGRQGLIQVPFRDPAARLVEQGLEKWRAAAVASVWNRENSEEALALSRIFLILLEATACDLRALAWCVAERISPGQPQETTFGRFADQERALVLKKPSQFPDELAILNEIYKAAKGPNSNQDRIQHIAAIANEQLAKGFRIVVFASSPALADHIYKFLMKACGVPVFRHRLGDEKWHAFHDVTAPALLVCDSRAEEGLNLQGGKTCMIHADFPLSPNSLEQRMGRLDRFGVGNAVVSLSLIPEECPYQQAWLDCLNDAYGVFSRSIAALQYVVEDEMRSLSSALFTDGALAFRESILRLSGDQGVLQKELKAIRAQDELDSIGVVAGDEDGDTTANIEAFEADSGRLQASVESWLCERLHFKCFGLNNHSDNVVRYQFQSGQHRPTLMSISDFQLWFESALERETQHPNFNQLQTWALTFSRETARSRRVGLGRIGNPILDCLHSYLQWDDRGTCFALWRVSPLVKPSETRLFLRFDFVIEIGLKAVSALAKAHPELSEAALRRRGDAAFPPISRSLWLSEDLEQPDEIIRAELDRPYQKSATETNINQDRWPSVQSHYDLANWPHLCRAARAAAVDAVVRQVDLAQLTHELAARLELDTNVVKEQSQSRIQALSQSPREAGLAQNEWGMEMKMREALLAGIHEHRIRLDAAGAVFLAGAPLSS